MKESHYHCSLPLADILDGGVKEGIILKHGAELTD